MRSRLNNQDGFTLVEIIAVLILLGILAAVAVPRYIDLTANAEIRALEAAVAELNGRENMNWANIKLSAAGWVDDATTYGLLDPQISPVDSLGDKYTWTVAPSATGGTLTFDNSTSIVLIRDASTNITPGLWHE